MVFGVFDSGVGGLTVYKELIKEFPSADFIYMADLKRVPYGNKSSDTIIRYATECAEYLVDECGASALVIGCNTLSSYAIDHLKNMFNIPVFGIIEASAYRAVEVTKNHKLGLIASNATVKGGKYLEVINSLDSEAVVIQKACPLFVNLVEEGIVSGELVDAAVKYYLDDMIENGIDTLILGCTHYSILADSILRRYPELKLADGTSVITKQIVNSGIELNGSGKREILTTYRSDAFDFLKSYLVGDIPDKTVDLQIHV